MLICMVLHFNIIGSAPTKACNINDDPMHLACAAQIVHKEMLDYLMDPL